MRTIFKKLSAKKNTIIKIIVILFIIGIISVTLAVKQYLTPVHKFIRETFCSLDGKQIEVVMDITCYKHLLGATKIEGLIAVDGKVYRNVRLNNDSKSLSQLLKETPIFLFYAWPHDGHWITADQLHFYYSNTTSRADDFTYMHIYIMPSSEEHGECYYGPAKTKEEAMEILNKWR